MEEAVKRAADSTHDPDVWHLESDEVVASSHGTGGNKGERKLRPYLQYYTYSRHNDDDHFDMYAYYWGMKNRYVCGICYRRNLAEDAPVSAEDDEESHAKWEAALCDLLSQTDVFAGVSECAISFVNPSAPSEEKAVEVVTQVSFKTPSNIYDTPESLQALELAMLKTADETHDPDVWFLDSDEIISSSHSIVGTTDDGGRKLRPYLQYYTYSRYNDDDHLDMYANYYGMKNRYVCGICYRRERRRLGGDIKSVKDDDESHANWEAALCKALGEMDEYEGVTDCVISFVDST